MPSVTVSSGGEISYARPAPATPQEFFVATTGSDSTGTGAALNPWATIDHARAYVRENAINVNQAFDVTVWVAPGKYWLTSKVPFQRADSGSNGLFVRYRNSGAPGTAQVYGGKVMTGWSLFSGSIYRVALAGPIVNTMWENGVRAYAARTPAYVPDASFPMAKAPYLHSAGVDQSHTVLQYTPGDLTPGTWDLSSAQIKVWSDAGANVETDWFTDIIPVASVNAGANQVTLAAASLYPLRNGTGAARYFAQGDLSMLTGPGQFYHDVTGGFLYYWPNATPIASQEIVVPAMNRVFEVTGALPTAPAHHIAFDGFEIQYSDFLHTWQVADPNHLDAIVYGENVEHIEVTNCNVHNAGTHGIYFHGYAKTCRVEKTQAHHCGGYGIHFENYPSAINSATSDVNTGHYIGNWKAFNCGELIGDGCGLYMLNASSSTIEYFEVHDTPRWGVNITAGYFVDAAKVWAAGNITRYGRLTKNGQDSGDMGALYLFGTGPVGAPGINTFNQIIIDSIGACASMLDAAPDGVFPDNETWGQLLSNIQVTNVQGTQFRTNSGGHTATNCSWVGGFNPALMDTANIGVKSDFPY